MNKNTKRTVSRLEQLDLHDDNLLEVKICLPETKQTNATRIDFLFRDDSTGKQKLVSFRSCANLRYIMDFDVMSANWFAQTERFAHEVDPTKMRRFVQAQMPHWHLRYMPPQPRDKPVRKKLLLIRSYRLFRIRFFGGLAEILAKKLVIKKGPDG